MMDGSMFPALLMSAIAFLIPLAQITLFKALLKAGTKTQPCIKYKQTY